MVMTTYICLGMPTTTLRRMLICLVAKAGLSLMHMHVLEVLLR